LKELTLAILKPDTVSAGNSGKILDHLERAGFELRGLRMLRLTPDATWDQIRKQYRKLMLKYNADRPQSEKQRALNVERLKKLNAAYAVLKAQHEQKVAA
jgi:nucleoside diphosphate kinase